MAENMEDEIEKTDEKGKKAKKAKKVKEKKPKTKKDRKPLSKKQKIIGLVVLVLFISAGSFAGAYFINRKKEPAVYLPAFDNIPAITEVVGKRKESKEVEEPEKEPDSKKDKKETDEPVDPNQVTETHIYLNVKAPSEDIGVYITYLMDEFQFVALDDYDVNEPEGVIEIVADSKEKDQFIKMNFDYKEGTYTIVITKQKGSVKELQDQIEEEKRLEKEKEEQENTISRSAAEQKLRRCSPSDLGIVGDISNYSIIFDVGISIIDGGECYGLNVYEKKESGAMYIKGIFYVARDGSKIYKYDLVGDVYTQIVS